MMAFASWPFSYVNLPTPCKDRATSVSRSRTSWLLSTFRKLHTTLSASVFNPGAVESILLYFRRVKSTIFLNSLLLETSSAVAGNWLLNPDKSRSLPLPICWADWITIRWLVSNSSRSGYCLDISAELMVDILERFPWLILAHGIMSIGGKHWELWTLTQLSRLC